MNPPSEPSDSMAGAASATPGFRMEAASAGGGVRGFPAGSSVGSVPSAPATLAASPIGLGASAAPTDRMPIGPCAAASASMLNCGPACVGCGPLSAVVMAEASAGTVRSEEHTSELQSQSNLVCRLLLEKKKKKKK